MNTTIKRLVVAVLTAGALAGIAGTPPAHAGPYCDPTSRSYDWDMCVDEPQNDPACGLAGDMAQCTSDWRDFMNQYQEQNPVPNYFDLKKSAR